MAKYKLVDSSPRLLAVDLMAQLLPGTFEPQRCERRERVCAWGAAEGDLARVCARPDQQPFDRARAART
jgi:hypothetical protein